MKKLIVLLAIFIFLTGNVKSQLIYYNWNPVYSPVSVNLNSVYLSGALIAAGNSGTVIYSSNSGGNWSVLNSGTSANLNSAYGQTTVLSVGASGTILKSTNNGLNWTSNPSPTSNNLNSVSNYVSPNYKMVCGDGGKIFASSNNGTNWTEVNSGTTNSLRSIYYNSNISVYRSYICGDNGSFLKLIYTLPVPPSITVVPYSTGVANNFYGVSALGDTSGIMLVGSGGKIMKSTNGGVSWTLQLSGTTNTLRFINAITANDIWVGGDNGTILHTTNGGVQWLTQYVGSTASVNSMLFLSGVKAIAVGSGGTILECNFPNPLVDTTLKRIKLDGNNISAYFQNTGIFNQNTSYGNTAGFEWPKGTNRYAIFTSGLSISAMVGGNLRQAMCSYKGEYRFGMIIGGTPQVPAALNKIWKVSAGDNCYTSIDWANWGMIVPYGAPYRDMNNNGQYDACIDIPGMRNASQTIFMALTDGFTASHSPGEGFGGGTLPLNADLKITAYTYGDTTLNDVQFIKYDLINRGSVAWNNVYMSLVGDYDVGDANDDYLAMDSTRNMWIGYNADNMDGSGQPPTYGANPPAVGMRVLKFLVNKTVAPFDTIRTTSGIRFTCTSCSPPPCESDPNGEPLGAYNMMKGFKKDGSKWMNPTFTPPRPAKFIYTGEPEPNTGWTEPKGFIGNCGGDTGAYFPTNPPGDRRFVLSMGKDNFTMNPGDSQTIIVAQMIARGTSNLNSVTKLKQLADLVANYTVGIKQISAYVPNLYALYQNYPNPFNPVTKIKFDIPSIRQSVVTLKIFDVMGREVQTLVNESLQPGTYETTFDGSNLTSGVYFYQLTSDNYKETKKLLLLK
jgi:photosystem II stability/assembly factor-like uncharacterized protein